MEVGAVRSNETLRMNATTGELKSLGGVTKYSTSDLVDVNADDIMATARNPVTMGPPSTITTASIVRANGVDMPISTALALGWIVRTADGFKQTAKYAAEREASASGKA
jgi:hypothetical protein